MERFGTAAIVGVGLIGGSIGLTLRSRGLVERVIGIGRSQANLDDALRVGAVDKTTTDLLDGVSQADVVVVCTPVTKIAETVLQASRAGKASMLIVDAGSTKRLIVEEIESDPKASALFVGSHPIAGSERKGAASALLGLLDGRVCVVTPTSRTSPEKLERASEFWKALGCRIVELDPGEHDRTLAQTSHLPHAVAAALAAAVPQEALGLAAGAYRDGTRVAMSDAKLWLGIFRANQTPLLQSIQDFERELANLKQLIVDPDDRAFETWWNMARSRRETLSKAVEEMGNNT